jgi:hypothetical protein
VTFFGDACSLRRNRPRTAVVSRPTVPCDAIERRSNANSVLEVGKSGLALCSQMVPTRSDVTKPDAAGEVPNGTEDVS